MFFSSLKCYTVVVSRFSTLCRIALISHRHRRRCPFWAGHHWNNVVDLRSPCPNLNWGLYLSRGRNVQYEPCIYCALSGEDGGGGYDDWRNRCCGGRVLGWYLCIVKPIASLLFCCWMNWWPKFLWSFTMFNGGSMLNCGRARKILPLASTSNKKVLHHCLEPQATAKWRLQPLRHCSTASWC